MAEIKFVFTPRDLKSKGYHPFAILRRALRSFLRQDSLLAYHAMKNPGNWECMEVIYNNKPRARNRFFPGLLDSILLNSKAAQATRSRKDIVCREISRLISQHNAQSGDFNIISLGSGPAHDIIAAFTSIPTLQPVFATCVDIDSQAIAYGRKMAHHNHLSEVIEFIHGDAGSISPGQKKYDVASVIGLLEYLSPEHCIKFLSGIKDLLHADSRILICNMQEHRLSRIMAFLGVWTLEYRRLEALEEITRASGFDIEKSYYGPDGLNSFIVARNRASPG